MPSLSLINTLPSIWAAKFCSLSSRYLNYGGSTLPGRIALLINPGILKKLSSQLKEGCILVTGTNGKTTTSLLLAHILSHSGKKVIHNRSGANMLGGVATAFLQESNWRGKLPADIGVIEVDEASMPFVASQVRVKGVIVTNIFRDQLDRYGEVYYTLSRIKEGLKKAEPNDFIILNADDPLLLDLKKDAKAPVYFYGISNWDIQEVFHAADINNCQQCGSPYFYLQNHLAHLGKYFCPGCGIKRPTPLYNMTWQKEKYTQSTSVLIAGPKFKIKTTFYLPGLFNLYNLMAASTCSLILRVNKNIIKKSIESFKPSFGRMETINIKGKKVLIALIKNPTGANEVLKTVKENNQDKVLILAINDSVGDGLDISWLWDSNFEILSKQENIKALICSGQRGYDMALRLKYAGLDTKIMMVEDDFKKAFSKGLEYTLKIKGCHLYILPTYTAMLKIGKIINQLGY